MAQKGIGRLLQFGIAKETTRGTPNASADFWIPFAELDFNEKWENVIARSDPALAGEQSSNPKR